MEKPKLHAAVSRMAAHLKWRLMYAVTEGERQAYLGALAALVLT